MVDLAGSATKPSFVFLVLHVVTRFGVTSKCARAESGLSTMALCMAIIHSQNVVYASDRVLDRMVVCTCPRR
jgi:hypothetical protein